MGRAKYDPSSPPPDRVSRPPKDSIPYDVAEVRRIFLRRYEKRAPERYAEQRRRSLADLFKTILDAASSSGYEVTRERGGFVISHPPCGAVYLGTRESSGEPFIVPIQGGRPSRLPIEYDAGVGYFVGVQPQSSSDEPVHPKDAAIAVVELISEMIDMQLSEKTRPR